MTLSVYVDTALMLLDIPIPFYFVIALLLTIGYVAFGTAVSVPPKVDIEHQFDDDRRDDMEPMPRSDGHTGIKEGPGY